ARADVEDTGHLLVLVKPDVHVGDVADVNEIAPLLARRVATAALEELGLTRRRDLTVQVKRHARHRPLVCLAGPVDVEVAQPDDLRAAFRVSPAPLADPPPHV